MAGKPGRSGGKRAGAGRPVESVTLRRSQKWLAHEFAADGRTIGLGRLVEAVEISRNRVLLRFDDGETLELIR